jgi:hypothetical protein
MHEILFASSFFLEAKSSALKPQGQTKSDHIEAGVLQLQGFFMFLVIPKV